MTKNDIEEFDDALNNKQMRAIAVLVAGGNNLEAAQHAGVHVRSVQRWRNLPEFDARLRAELQSITDSVTNKLINAAMLAVDEAVAIMTDPETSAAVRVQAAQMILNHGLGQKTRVEALVEARTPLAEKRAKLDAILAQMAEEEEDGDEDDGGDEETGTAITADYLLGR